MKNTLITGASRGLGLELARQQLELGNRVWLVNRRASAELRDLLERFPEQASFIPCDLQRPELLKQEVFAVLGQQTPIHGFVSNAATAYDDLVTNLDAEKLESMFRVNVFAPIMLSKLVIRNMLLHKVAGSIVHLSSISVHTGYKGLAMYAATKGAMEAFSKNTAREWGGKGIRSNCVVAGFMDTDMSASLTPEQKQKIADRTALKRPTTLQSVAATITFLLSEASQSMTGQNLFVDSGTI